MSEDNKKTFDDGVEGVEENVEIESENTGDDETNINQNLEDNSEKSDVNSNESENSEKPEKPEQEELEKRFLRLQADFANYKKRVEKEKQEIYKSASTRLITNLLPVIDDFERAISHVDESGKEAFINGINLIMKSMNEVLSKEGLEYIDVKDADFDPNLHYAVMMEEVEGVESGKITVEVQKGYKVSGKVVRPSMVKVSK